MSVSTWVAAFVAAVASIVVSGEAVGAAPAPGALIASEPMPGAPNGASAYHILYRSTDQRGADVAISGVVIVPTGAPPPRGRDIVAFGHSSVGVAEKCAPSRMPTVFRDIPGLPEMLAAGYVVTASDFQGLGTPGPSPYLVGISSGRGLLDSVRAARALPQAHAGSHYALWGLSQGAHAALWAAEIAARYAGELRLVGVAAAAPPTDLIAGFDRIENKGITALLTAYTSTAWSQIYHLSLSTFADAKGQRLIEKIAATCLHESEADKAVDVATLVATDQVPHRLGDPWTQPMRDNSVRPVNFAVPLLIAQGSADAVVSPVVVRAFASQACAVGNAVYYISMPHSGHQTIAYDTAGFTVPWLKDRFAGKAAPSDCDNLTSESGASQPSPTNRSKLLSVIPGFQ